MATALSIYVSETERAVAQICVRSDAYDSPAKIIGPNRALEVILGGVDMDAETAEKW